MLSVTQQLADFAFNTRYEDLTEEVVHETKRVLLDSLGCALGGRFIDKSRLAVEFAQRMSARAQSTIIGISQKVDQPMAAFANGELINALDYDPILPPGHVSPYVIPAALVAAESVKASGKDLILAVAVGHEISTRIGAGLYNQRDFHEEGPRKGKIEFPAVQGNYLSSIFGGCAAAGKLMGLDRKEMLDAFGISGFLCPIPGLGKWLRTLPMPAGKYHPAGWLGLAELNAINLAKLGYLGDTSVLDGEYGYWRFIGSSKWEPEKVTQNLGKSWRFPSITLYKTYPCCYLMQTALDCFIEIIEEHNLKPQDIDKVNVWLESLANEPVFTNNEIRSAQEAQFSVAYVFAAAAHRIAIGPEWQDAETFRNPNILEFMKKVSFAPYQDYEKLMGEDPNSRPAKAAVMAKGKTYEVDHRYAKGSPATKATFATDNDLKDKFRRNASRTLAPQRIDRVAKDMLELEKVVDICRLMRDFKP